MAVPTTLVEVAAQAEEHALAAETDQRQELARLQAGFATADAERAALAATLADLGAQAAEIRRRLPEQPMPADGTALIEQLEQLMIQVRAAHAGLLGAELAADETRRRLEAGEQQLAAAAAAAQQDAAAHGAEQAAAERRIADRTALTVAPLDELQARATAALAAGAEPLTAARARLATDVPAELLARARARRGARRQQLERVRTLAEDAAAIAAGERGDTAAKRLVFARADAALHAYATAAQGELQRALDLLEGIVAAPPPTPAEANRIADKTIVKNGKDAVTAEADRDTAADTLAAAEAALEAAELNARAADIDADVSKDAAVKKATKDRDAAAATLAPLETAYTQKLRAALDLWEATVPDATWRLLADLDEAETILGRLEDVDPAAELADPLDDAEQDLVGALVADEKQARARAFVARAVVRSEARRDAADALSPARLDSALRGDG
jgi:hypothetical protein